MEKGKGSIVLVLVLLAGVGTVMLISVVGGVIAATAPSTATPFLDRVDTLNTLIGSLFVALTWFTIRLIRKYDTNQDIMFTRLTKLSEDFYILLGEHNGIMRNGGHKK